MTAVSRTRYFSGQYLRTADFVDEQRHHLDMRRRHNIGHHSFGVVAGLDLTEEEGSLILGAGMAVDGYGRELVVAERIPIGIGTALQDRDTDSLEIWLAYGRVPASDAPPGYATCADDDAAYRDVEKPVVRFVVPDPDETDRRCPATVPDGDCGFGPERTPPDDPLDDYPVYLGTVTEGNDNDELNYTIDGSGRPWAGLIGEEVRAASGRTRVQVGADHEDDPFRFAVRIPGLEPEGVPRLAVQSGGSVLIAGRTTFLGNVAVVGGVEIEAGPVIEKPQPWTLYRTVTEQATESGTTKVNELRLEMDPSGEGGTDSNTLTVGVWKTDSNDPSGEERFVSCLTIDDNGNLTITGNLRVNGKIIEGRRQPPRLSREALGFINSAFLGGMTGSSILLNRLHDSFPDDWVG